MKRFSRALEQAERDRVRRDDSRPTSVTALFRPPSTVAEPGTARAATATSGDAERRPGVAAHLVSLLAPASFEAEQYRALRHVVEQLKRDSGLSVLAISSPGVGDGKTTTAINLAGALAQPRRARVLVIDADLRRPSVMASLGGRELGTGGLVAAIEQPGVDIESVVTTYPEFNLSVVPAGGLPAVPYEFFRAPRCGEILAEARARYDYVIVDTAPLVSLPDCKAIAQWVDGFVIVVGAHHTARKLVTEALAVVDSAKVVGLVFNGDDANLASQYPGYYASVGVDERPRGWRRAVSFGSSRRAEWPAGV